MKENEMGREEGFYWVRMGKEWYVCEWVNGAWWGIGADFPMDQYISEIDERLIERTP